MIQPSVLMLLASVLMALLAVDWVYFKILKIAKDKDLVDNPDARKLQKTPIPVMGGIAVFFGVAVGGLTAGVLSEALDVTHTSYLLPLMLAMVVMLYVGAMDDIVGLTPTSRIVIEVLSVLALIYGGGGCLDSFHGAFGVDSFSWWLAVPLTIFAGVGIINAMNMIDGVNGLSSGLCIAVSALFGSAFLKSGDVSNAVLAFIMVASLLPFYIHNVFGNRSRMFIGDAGTMMMGILMVWFVMSVIRSDSPVVYYSTTKNVGLVAMVLAFLSVPVFDTLRVMTMRMAHGMSPFHPDKTHLHHVFIAAGVSHFITSSTVILIDLCVTLIWALSVYSGLGVTGQLWVVIIASALLVWGTYAFIRYNEMHHTNFMHWLSHFSVSTHLGHTNWWLHTSAILDRREGEEADPDHQAHMEQKFDHPVNDLEEERTLVVNYLKGKVEVHVDDITAKSGAAVHLISPILTAMLQEGVIEVVKTDSSGAPMIVALKG